MPTPDRVRTIFEQALSLKGDDRRALLDRECAGDRALRERLEALLARPDRDSESMSAVAGRDAERASPALDLDRTLDPPTSLGERGAASPSRTPTQPPAATSPGEDAGTDIGPYRLLQQIGEGGFGTVFMAEQREPVQRMVALKIIKLGMDTRQVVAHFEQERQALAVLDHPSIAKVFDAGATASGRPYFVMELVKGEPITFACDRIGMGIEARLGLFVQVCAAVQHAHTKGIIHRDIKPSNVLVAMLDGRPSVKVIDFGVAKATAARLTEKTFFTEHRQLIGTPEYMSPEQADGSLDIDTRTDIYSLGALLYELLTGSTPFSGAELRSAAFAEIQRIIREVDPPKPSTRLSQERDTRAGIAARRRLEPGRIGMMLRGDLDWIVMKALEKDRRRRYETADALAMDIQRHLAGEPVMAAPPSRAYRLRKFIRRNRVQVAAAGVVAAAVITGMVGTSLGLARALRERSRANEEAARARLATEQESIARRKAEETSERARVDLRKAELARDFLLVNVIRAADPYGNRGADIRVRDLLDDASRRLDDGSLLKDDPAVEEWIRMALAYTYRGLGLYDQAGGHLDRSVALRRQLFGETSREYAIALNDQAASAYEQGDLAAAIPLYRKAIEILRILAQAERVDGTTGRNSGSLALALHNISALLLDRGELDEAEATAREALEIWTRQGGPEHEAVATAKFGLGQLLAKRGRHDEAEQAMLESLAIRRRVKSHGDPVIGTSLVNLGWHLRNRGRLEEASALLGEAVEHLRVAYPEGHPTLAAALQRQAALLETDDPEQALGIALEAIAMLRRSFTAPHARTAACLRLAGDILRRLGRLDRSEALLLESHAMATALAEGDARDAMVASSLSSLGATRLAIGRTDEARRDLDAAASMQRGMPRQRTDLARTLRRSGQAHLDLGAFDAGVADLEEAMAIMDLSLPPGHFELQEYRSELERGRSLRDGR